MIFSLNMIGLSIGYLILLVIIVILLLDYFGSSMAIKTNTVIVLILWSILSYLFSDDSTKWFPDY